MRAHATKLQAPRLERLEDLSAHYSEDPYTHSQRARKSFRAEKKVEQALVMADKTIKEKYGLPSELALERADGAGAAAEARDECVRSRVARSVFGEGRYGVGSCGLGCMGFALTLRWTIEVSRASEVSR